MRNVNSRLDALERIVKVQAPAVMYVKLVDGSTVTTDPVEVWDFFKDPEKRRQVVSIEANRADYTELAGLVEVLCR